MKKKWPESKPTHDRSAPVETVRGAEPQPAIATVKPEDAVCPAGMAPTKSKVSDPLKSRFGYELKTAGYLADAAACLRIIRDTGSFTTSGAHSFREWCVQRFGDKLGCFIDDIL